MKIPQPNTYSATMKPAIAPTRVHSLGVSAPQTRDNRPAFSAMVCALSWPEPIRAEASTDATLSQSAFSLS